MNTNKNVESTILGYRADGTAFTMAHLRLDVKAGLSQCVSLTESGHEVFKLQETLAFDPKFSACGIHDENSYQSEIARMKAVQAKNA